MEVTRLNLTTLDILYLIFEREIGVESSKVLDTSRDRPISEYLPALSHTLL